MFTNYSMCIHMDNTTSSPDGLTDRFNKTLKAALQKVAIEDHLYHSYCLHTVRSLMQATGFLPFELLYACSWAVRGPLDIHKETCMEPKTCSDNVVSY